MILCVCSAMTNSLHSQNPGNLPSLVSPAMLTSPSALVSPYGGQPLSTTGYNLQTILGVLPTPRQVCVCVRVCVCVCVCVRV